jgi:membrane protease YdiL (CAAX protease family)
MKGLLAAFGIDEPVNRETLKVTTILLWAPVALTTWRYYGGKAFYLQHLAASLAIGGSASRTAELYTFLTAFLLLGLVSLLIIRLGFHEPLAGYGLRLGEWRFGLKVVAVLGPVLVLLALLSSRNSQFLAEYPLDPGACASVAMFTFHAAAYLVYYTGFEIFFRGFVQQGLAPRFGVWPAILVQTALSCLVHIGKPDAEIYGAILGGVVFGIVAARSRSLLWVILIHWLLGVALDLAICLR